MPGVAAAVAALERLVKPLNLLHAGEVASALQVAEELVALGIDIGGRDVSDLARGAAQADSLVVDGGAHPDGTAVLIHQRGAPKPHVMPLPRVVPDRLLEGQILFASPEVEVADGGIFVRSLEDAIQH